MGTMIQIRNVPTQVHRRLKAKAAMSGQSLSSFLLAEIQRLAERPTEEELLQHLHQRTAVTPTVSPADAVRAERDAR
jgi:plasmid stability protein